MRKTAGYTWIDDKTNTEIAKETKYNPNFWQIQEYRRNLLQHMNRILHNWLLRVLKATDQQAEDTRGDHNRDF
jgi:hypothetical protein